MLRTVVLCLSRAPMIVASLAVAIVACRPRAVRCGDRLQVALPLLARACAGSRSGGAELLARGIAMFTVAHASMRGPGEAPVSLRPGGGPHGFPSARTAAAIPGTSSPVHDCLRGAPVARAWRAVVRQGRRPGRTASAAARAPLHGWRAHRATAMSGAPGTAPAPPAAVPLSSGLRPATGV